MREFTSLTQAGEKTAAFCLASADWNLAAALDTYFANPDYFVGASGGGGGGMVMGGGHGHIGRQHQPDRKKIDQVYARYRDPGDASRISPTGTVRLLEDLQLDPAGITTLILAWKFKCQTQCEFSDKEFCDGMYALGCDSIDKLRSKLHTLGGELEDPVKFKDFYQVEYRQHCG